MYSKAIVLLVTGIAAFASPIDKGTVSAGTFNDLDMFMKYASSAYSATCPSPLGNTLVTTASILYSIKSTESEQDVMTPLQFNNLATSTQGFLARDDTNKLLVLALRGSQQLTDVIIDVQIVLTPLVSPGVSAGPGVRVHTGFLTAYNSIAPDVISAITTQLAGPAAGYALRTSGHSLGGSLSSLAAVSLKSNFPNSSVQMYTYGQPRTGNPAYATMVNSMFGTDAFRSVHTTDLAPQLFSQLIGYRHHAFEYWQTPDPASAATVKVCDASGEDPTCSNSVLLPGLTAHTLYFNRAFDTPFCT